MNPKLFLWARETAGLSVEDAARKLSVEVDKLTAIEAGSSTPSRSTLAKMAKTYRRSLVVFYMASPPPVGDRGKDFRTVSGNAPSAFNADLDALLRDIKVRQGIARSAQEDLESEPVTFVGAGAQRPPVRMLAQRITDTIKFSLDPFRNAKDISAAFAYLRRQIEGSGVFVLLAGDLGSYHTVLSPEIFRGFAIADRIAPFVVINDQDARASWSFTALHELVHIWIGDTGLSGTSADNEIEQYCNDVAAEILLPLAEIQFLSKMDLSNFDILKASITEFAERSNLSRAMVAYRAFKGKLIAKETWSALSHAFYLDWQASKTKKPQVKGKSTGPNYYVVRRHRVGHGLADLIRRSLSEGIMTYAKAGRVLGVRPTNVNEFLKTGISIQ